MSSRSNGVTKVAFTRSDDRVGRLVGGVLGLAHPLGDVLAVGAVAEHLGQQRGAVDEVAGRLGEQVVERRCPQGGSARPRRTPGSTDSNGLITGVNEPYMLGCKRLTATRAEYPLGYIARGMAEHARVPRQQGRLPQAPAAHRGAGPRPAADGRRGRLLHRHPDPGLRGEEGPAERRASASSRTTSATACATPAAAGRAARPRRRSPRPPPPSPACSRPDRRPTTEETT